MSTNYIPSFRKYQLSSLPFHQLEGSRSLCERISVAGPDVLSVGQGLHSQNLLRRLEREASVR